MRTEVDETELSARKLLVSDRQGAFVIELTDKQHVTFAAVNPGSQGSRQDPYVLRVWTGKKLDACFDTVRSFRDLAIPLARRVTKETGASTWTKDSAGNFDGHTSRQLVEDQFVLEAGDIEEMF